MKILGVIHLKGLPGSTSNTKKLDEIIELAQNDVNALSDGGIHGLIIEILEMLHLVKTIYQKDLSLTLQQ